MNMSNSPSDQAPKTRQEYRDIIDVYFKAFGTGDFSPVQMSASVEFLSPISGDTFKGRREIVDFLGSVSTRVSNVKVLTICVDYPNASGVWQMTTTRGVTYTLNNHFRLNAEGLDYIWPMFDPKAILSPEAPAGTALLQWLRGTDYYDVAARVPQQPAGLTISAQGRLFITVPRWLDIPDPSVAEILPDGSLVPYPNAEMNQWDGLPGESARGKFVCAQSVQAVGSDLWILDPAAPLFGEGMAGIAKLVQVDLATDRVVQIHAFDADTAPMGSYLNDVRLAHGMAFISDSGLGAIVVLDLVTGRARRLLTDHPSTKADEAIRPIIEGQPWALADGTVPVVHVDGIALDPGHKFLYYKALRGARLYRIPLAALMNEDLSSEELGAQVETIATLGPSDGLEFDAEGNLYFTDLENSAISRLTAQGERELVAAAGDFLWPDTITISSEGDLLFTASQFHRMPAFQGGVDRRTSPYSIFRLRRAT
jgi:sugar lactone lactonase YvrE